MAKETPTPPAEKLIEAKVLRNYGSHVPGAMVRVTQREYDRLRAPVLDDNGDETGRFTYPVLITKEHEAEQDAARKRAEAAGSTAAKKLDERSLAPGWAEFEKRSLEQLRANFVAQQERQAALVTGVAANAS